RKEARQARRCRRSGAQAGWNPVRDLARRHDVQPLSRSSRSLGAPPLSSFTDGSCPKAVTATGILGAREPRAEECGLPTDCNLCASEREYSIETARHPPSRLNRTIVGHRGCRKRSVLTAGPLHTGCQCDEEAPCDGVFAVT